MKLTHSTKRAKGMTLLELTVVILVLLSLISILFVGARAWKKGSDRAASILIIRNTQQAVRSYANMYNKNETDTFTEGDVFGAGKFVETDPSDISHPAGTGYEFTKTAAGTVPALGTLYITTTGTGNNGDANDYNPEGYGTDDSTVKDW